MRPSRYAALGFWAFLCLSSRAGLALTVTKVEDTADGVCDVDCSLREAITEANSNPGADTISFAIGSGVRTIAPGSPLPAIADPLLIDGTSQPGYAGLPLIELNGESAGSGDGLVLQADGCSVLGLAINRFPMTGVRVDSDANILKGNHIGTDPAGTGDLGNGAEGILVEGGVGNQIGGASPGDGNVVSGNTGTGITLQSDDNHVKGNKIGTDVSGLAARGNGGSGILIQGGSGNRIGGAGDGEGNVISGNSDDGVEILSGTGNEILGNFIGIDAEGANILGNGDTGVSIGDDGNTVGSEVPGGGNVISANGNDGIFADASGTVIRGNLIGLDATGTVDLGNGNAGVYLQGQDGRIGGTGEGAGNTIAFNGLDGVTIAGASSSGNSIQRNAVFSNGGLGVDLNDEDVTPNDPLDADSGSNGLQNFPVLTVARTAGAETLVEGVLVAAPGVAGYRIEIFSSGACDGSGNGEGGTYLGFLTADTDEAGTVSFSILLGLALAEGRAVTATATDPQNNTSEFSACVASTLSSGLGGRPSCGNGTIDSGEECDDGNAVNGDGCSLSCLNEAGVSGACGNGVFQEDERCDDGNADNGDGCNADCGLEITPSGDELVRANPGVDFTALPEREAVGLVSPDGRTETAALSALHLPESCACAWSIDPPDMADYSAAGACETDMTPKQRGEGTISVFVYCGRDGSGTFQQAVTVVPLGVGRDGGGSSGGCQLYPD